MRVFNRYISPRGLTLFAFELVLIAGSVLYAMQQRGGVDTPGALGKVLFITALCQLSFYYHDLYDLTVVNSRRELLVRLLQASGAASLLLAALYMIFPRLIIGHGVLASSVPFFVVAIAVWRLLFLQLGRARGLQEHVLIVGTSAGARTVAREVLHQHDYAYKIVGFIDDDPAMQGRSVVNPTVIGTTADIVRLVREQRVNRIIVGLADRRGRRSCRACASRSRKPRTNGSRARLCSRS
jgi:FlaA1/EpsC-like NDP-sugar epimerase